jgi:mRNA-degrading endonuclease RelE of RelBE toxin-antitoxin system
MRPHRCAGGIIWSPLLTAVRKLIVGLTDAALVTIIIVIMARRQGFSLVYAPVVRQHLRAIEARYHSLIRAIIEEQLIFEPDVETKNRKPLRRPVAGEAAWELRFGPGNRFRVFYDVDRGRREVHVLAIGVKVGNRLLIGGEEVDA